MIATTRGPLIAPLLATAAVLLTFFSPSRAAAGAPCLAVGEEACLLDDRFLVRVLYDEGAERREARVLSIEATGQGTGQDTARFSFSPADQRDRMDLTLRLVDGRGINGYFWLLSQTNGGRAEIEITDLALGRTRRFIHPAGVRHQRQREAFSGEAQTIVATLDTARAATQSIGPQGGFVEATDSGGTKFRLVVPKNALIAAVDVTLTPAATISGLPFTGGLARAVYIEPKGLILSESGLLTLTPSPALPRAQQLTFAFRDLSGELSLAPPMVAPGALVLPVHRFGGYGVGAGTAADLAAQLGRPPSRSEDRFLQRLAGLLLPLHRAGTTALPATVLQLLQQEYTAIKPKVLALKQGKLEANFPIVRNWQNAAKDTRLTAKLATQLQEIQSAEIAGAVISFNGAAGARTGPDADAAARPCQNVKAARTMLRSYNVLRSRGKQGLVNKQKVDKCALFTIKWNTILDWRPPYTAQSHHEVLVDLLVTFDETKGSFWGFKPVKVIEDRVTQPLCNAFFSIVKTGSPTVPLVLFYLQVPGVGWSGEDDADLVNLTQSAVSYNFEKASKQDWLMTCTQTAGGVTIGPITSALSTSWSGTYTSFHLTELSGRGFRTTLVRSASPSVFAEKVYNQGNDLQYFEEHTLISVFFAPR
jgi:hypothetical protein